MELAQYFRNFYDDPRSGLIHPFCPYDQFVNLVPGQFFRPYTLSLRVTDLTQQIGASEVVNTDEFRVNIDVQHFKPEEISIKAKGTRLIITACHEERPDEHGFIMREFIRQCVLPNDVDPGEVTASLNKNGILSMKAPKKALEVPLECTIPITHEKGDF